MNKWRKWHRRIGIVVGIQVLLWISGGVIMSAIPIEMVRGKHLVEHMDVNVDQKMIRGMQPNLDITQWKQLGWQKRGQRLLIRA